MVKLDKVAVVTPGIYSPRDLSEWLERMSREVKALGGLTLVQIDTLADILFDTVGKGTGKRSTNNALAEFSGIVLNH